MKKLFILLTGILTTCLISSCAIKPSVTNQYQLTEFSSKNLVAHGSHSLLVTLPETIDAYDSEQMFYVDKRFELKAFAHNAWVASPGEMLFPLMLQSFQQSGYFNVVASGAYAEKTAYRLDTQLIELHQNFLTKPSRLSFRVKITLTDLNKSKVMGSKLINIAIKCPFDTPYGGVLAANMATKQFTLLTTAFAIKLIQQST